MMDDMITIRKITKDGVVKFNFMYNYMTDAPKDGATLIGIFFKGKRIAPSSYTGEIPYEIANRKLIG